VNPVEYFVRDATGRPVRIGDVAGGTTSGPDRATVFGPVVRLGNTQVLIRCSGTTATGDHKWLPVDGLFLVTPRLDDRLSLPADRLAGEAPKSSPAGSVDDFVSDVFGRPVHVGDAVASWSPCLTRMPTTPGEQG
jgi:hypothetical protein